MQSSLLRSLLFVPGNSEKMLQKALQAHADALVPDLEDSVPKEEKVTARNLVSKVLPSMRAQIHKRIQIIPRVNSFYTQWFEEDLKAVLQPGVSAVTIGKVETAEEMKEIVKAVAEKEKEASLPPNSVKVIPWLETAKGIAYAREICACGSRLVAIAFGAEDFTADMQIERTASGKEFYHARN
ncbi:Citrate lyase subunit beta [Galdieria sulphuraria]|nr:Citrate lyase subunit beta [Galdieria sulphuraria]